MACPDIDRLIDHVHDGNDDLELTAHVERCRSCQADLEILNAVRTAFEAEIEVPEELIERTLAAIPLPGESGTANRSLSLKHVLVAGVLGTSTAGFALVASGLLETGSPLHVFTFLSLSGVAAALVEIRAETAPRKAKAGV